MICRKNFKSIAMHASQELQVRRIKTNFHNTLVGRKIALLTCSLHGAQGDMSL